MLVSSKLTADSYQLCLHVCVTNKTLVSIDLLLFRFFFLFLREQIFFSYFSQILQQQKKWITKLRIWSSATIRHHVVELVITGDLFFFWL